MLELVPELRLRLVQVYFHVLQPHLLIRVQLAQDCLKQKEKQLENIAHLQPTQHHAAFPEINPVINQTPAQEFL